MKKQISQNMMDWLKSEVHLWKSEGTISDTQLDAILSKYDSQTDAENKKSTAFYTLISAASVLAGAALLLLIGYNWQALNYIAKLGIIFGITIAFQGLTLVARFRWENKALSEVFSFLSCICFGSGIWLIAQIFNLNSHYPDGFLWWALGSLPLAFLGQSSLLWFLVVTLEIIWCFTEASIFSNSTWIFFGRNTNLPSAAYLMPLLLLPGFIWAYLKNCPKTTVLHLIGFACWCLSLWIAWEFNSFSLPLLGALFALYWLAGLTIEIKEKLALVCSQIGLIAVWPLLCIFSFYDFQKEMTERIKPENITSYAAMDGTILFMIGIMIGLVYFKHAYSKNNSKSISSKELILAFAILTQLSMAPAICFFFNSYFAFTMVLISNLLMLGYSAVMMDEGLKCNSSPRFFLGVGSFLLWTIVRYFDLFGDFGGMLGASLLFFLSSLLLIGLAFFWRKRKAAFNVK
ncbi:MAG: DUF2157 domain-containing protein [Planctomycetes bacterium]|nr:DUF2157 domain-containing protein [Planctomycetota bacterium]NBY00928.1 DUF2157 domain-containing protein [Planctomycetota bacterium]